MWPCPGSPKNNRSQTAAQQQQCEFVCQCCSNTCSTFSVQIYDMFLFVRPPSHSQRASLGISEYDFRFLLSFLCPEKQVLCYRLSTHSETLLLLSCFGALLIQTTRPAHTCFCAHTFYISRGHASSARSTRIRCHLPVLPRPHHFPLRGTLNPGTWTCCGYSSLSNNDLTNHNGVVILDVW